MQSPIYLRNCARAWVLIWMAAIYAIVPAQANAAEVSASKDSVGKTIAIKSYAFVPAAKTVAAGTTVTWVNEDDDPHTVTGDAAVAAPNSPALDTREQYSFTFAKPGVYKYFCKLHPHMQGEIIVQ